MSGTPAIASETMTDCVRPLKILLVAPSPPPYGGIALQSRLLERLLRGDGHSVVFLPSNFPFPAGLGFLARFPGLRTAARFILIWPKLWAETRQAEIVHVMAASWWYFFLAVYPAVLAGRVHGKRVIVNYRGGAAKRFFQFYGWAAAPVFRLASAVTTPSQFLAEPIRQRFGVSVSIVPNILDTSAFPYRDRTEIRPRMLVTRHLEKIYDVETVLKAFRSVRESYSDASLWIAGTGSEEARLRGLVSAWNLQNVRFLGHVRHSELGKVYEERDILLNASHVDNFPAGLIEASGAGLVVVSTCAGGIPAIYEHEKSALLVEIGDWRQLALSVKRVLQFPSMAREMTRVAYEVAKTCAWSEVRKRLYSAYGWAPAERAGVTSCAAARPSPGLGRAQ